jgi:hypothetical protein
MCSRAYSQLLVQLGPCVEADRSGTFYENLFLYNHLNASVHKFSKNLEAI